MAAEELGGGVDDDVGAEVQRAAQVRRGERRVDHERHARAVRGLRERLEIGDGAGRVGDDLGVEQLRAAGLDRVGERLRVVGRDERGLDAEPPQRDVHQRVRAAVQRRAGDDVVAGVGQLREQHASRRPGRSRSRRRRCRPRGWRPAPPARRRSGCRAGCRCSRTSGARTGRRRRGRPRTRTTSSGRSAPRGRRSSGRGGRRRGWRGSASPSRGPPERSSRATITADGQGSSSRTHPERRAAAPISRSSPPARR